MRIGRRYLEFDAAAHCTLRCAYCSHLSPYVRPELADVGSFRDDVEALAGVMRVQRFRFVGGEPLLHDELEALIAIAHEAQISRRIVLCTNGQLVRQRLTSRMMDMLGSVDVSMYPDTPIDYDDVRGYLTEKSRKHHFRLNMSFKSEFMVVNLERPIDDADRVQHIYDDCKIAHLWGCHTFKNGVYYKCAKPVYQDEFLKAKGLEGPFRYDEMDGIPLHEPDLKPRLRAYLKAPAPMESCRWCLGTSGHAVPHRQLTRREIEDWDSFEGPPPT